MVLWSRDGGYLETGSKLQKPLDDRRKLKIWVFGIEFWTKLSVYFKCVKPIKKEEEWWTTSLIPRHLFDLPPDQQMFDHNSRRNCPNQIVNDILMVR